MTELQIGEEYDRQALRRLKDALRKAGAKRVGSFRGVFGSQEISNATFSVANGGCEWRSRRMSESPSLEMTKRPNP
jgi:hypothetical protein